MQKQRILTELLKSVPIGNPSWPLLEALAELAGVVEQRGCTHSRKDLCKHQAEAFICDSCRALAKLREVIG